MRLRKCGGRFVLTLGLLLPGLVSARIDIDPGNAPAQVVSWTGGDLVVLQDFCVLSVQASQATSTTVIPYRVMVEGPFELESGANTISGILEWVDPEVGSATSLSPDVFTSDSHTGAVQNCPGGDNGRLRITYPEAGVAGAAPGTYRQTYRIEVANNGQGKSQGKSRLDVELTLPDSVQVSEIDDIDLGIYAGTDLQGSDQLCVFRRSGGPYAVSVTGGGAGGSFVITNGAAELPLSLTWDDGSGPAALSPGALLPGRANAFTGSATCNNGLSNNAELSARIDQAEFLTDGIVAGGYAGTLTLTIELE
ncbi:MAG: hypothetical protein VX549_09280 [Pseudomonadota bacterium]|nr:hypothetical protein [Pseudomonadota bacterium]